MRMHISGDLFGVFPGKRVYIRTVDGQIITGEVVNYSGNVLLVKTPGKKLYNVNLLNVVFIEIKNVGEVDDWVEAMISKNVGELDD